MSMSIDSYITVGNNYKVIIDNLNIPKEYDDDYVEYLDSLGLECFAPYYDAEPNEWFVGYSINDILLSVDNWVVFLEEVLAAHDKLRKLCGDVMEIKLSGVPCVW